ncbi:unnamed protein product, partial [Adineta steineri]
ELMEDATHIPQLIALGAEFEEARALLEIYGNRLERAVEELLQKTQDSYGTMHEHYEPSLFERARTAVEKRMTKKIRLADQSAADQQRRTTLETIVPDLLRSSMETDDTNTDSQTNNGGSDDYLDLLLDEEETFIRDYRQRLVDDGFW